MVNPYGMVAIADGGAPRVITGYAREDLSGGQFVGGSTTTGVVSSGADSYAATDIKVCDASGANFLGIALNDASSGAAVAIAMKGMFIVPVADAGDMILAGDKVTCASSEVYKAGSRTAAYDVCRETIGRAVTCGSKGDYIILDLGA